MNDNTTNYSMLEDKLLKKELRTAKQSRNNDNLQFLISIIVMLIVSYILFAKLADRVDEDHGYVIERQK